MMNQDEIAAEAGMHRDTVGAIESGGGSPGKRRALDEALTRLEAEATLPPLGESQLTAPAAVTSEPQMIEFEVSGDFGVRVVVKGPVDSAAELEASVARLIREMRNES